jgi:hypothetical protein
MRSLASGYFGRATLLAGSIGDGGKPLRCLFAGSSPFLGTIGKRTFSGTPNVLENGIARLGSLEKIVRRYRGRFDLCMAVAPRKYDEALRGLFDYRGDICVRQVIDLTGTREEIRRNFHKTKRQISNSILSKGRLACRISRDPEDFRRFYREMFVPLIRKRYGGEGIEPYEDMERHLRDGFLLLVSHEGETVSGALCVVKGKTLVFRRTGVLGGDEKHIKAGAQNALYLFMISHAKELGLEALDTMNSVALLNDGVYKAKREWGAGVRADTESDTSVHFLIPEPTEAVSGFFEKNPLLVDGAGGLRGLVGLHWDGDPGALEDCGRLHLADGMSGLVIMTRGPGGARAIRWPGGEG